MLTTYRQLGLHEDTLEGDLADATNYGSTTYVLVTGAPPSTAVIRLEFSYVFEYIPRDAYYIYTNVD